MARLELDPREVELLSAVIDSTLSDLSFEISSTDRLDYREKLKERRRALRHIAHKLEETRAPVV